MNDQVMHQIQQWFHGQHVRVPIDWVKACVDWLQSETQISHNILEIQKQVFEQWLMTDLNQLDMAILPKNIGSERYTLNGIYCLQINSIVDVSQPMYSQLLQVQNRDDTNSSVSAETQVTQKPWEVKPSRMLMMKLTDGQSEVSGVEYRSIECLNDKLPPGCKVRIKGPVNCRRGVLMLTSSNIQIMGGEVEELFQENNLEAVLCRRLGRLPPTVHSNSAPDSSAQENNQDMDLTDELISQLTDDAFTTEQESGYATASVNQGLTSITPASTTSNSEITFDDLNEISDLDILQEIERVESSQTSGQNQTAVVPSLSSTERIENKAVKFDSRADDNISVIDLTQETILTAEQPKSNITTEKQLFTDHIFISQQNINQQHRSNFISKQKESMEQIFSSLNQNGTSTHSTNVNFSTSKGNGQLLESYVKGKDCDFTGHKRGSSAVQTDLTVPKLSGSSGTVLQTVTSNRQLEGFHSENIQNSINVIQKEATSLAFNNPSTDLGDKKFPFKYLCQLPSLNSLELPISFLVKACVITLLSKMQSDDKGWCLRARICDGTDILDVQFADQVLTQLVGFSSKQAEEIKKGCNSTSASVLRSGMSRCRNAIIEMCKLMQIDVDSAGHAIVVQLVDADDTYWKTMM